MRYIDTHGFVLPNGWLEEAEEALEAAKTADPGRRRAKVVNDHSSVWTELKERLAKLSHNKCWYCETRYERTDNEVDHFRPKNDVTGCSGHKGYWWLAFDWTNYRFSCTYCNRRRKDKKTGSTGGKGSHFPLWNEDARAHCPEDPIEEETPCLLDPTVAMDPGLLWFNDEGNAVAARSDNERWKLRAEKSIELYHLNYFATKEERQRLYVRISFLLRKGTRCCKRAINAVTKAEADAAEEMLTLVIRELVDTMAPDKQFSAAARAYLTGFRDTEFGWVVDNVFRAC